MLARINDHAIYRLGELLPWNWTVTMQRRKVAAERRHDPMVARLKITLDDVSPAILRRVEVLFDNSAEAPPIEQLVRGLHSNPASPRTVKRNPDAFQDNA